MRTLAITIALLLGVAAAQPHDAVTLTVFQETRTTYFDCSDRPDVAEISTSIRDRFNATVFTCGMTTLAPSAFQLFHDLALEDLNATIAPWQYTEGGFGSYIAAFATSDLTYHTVLMPTRSSGLYVFTFGYPKEQ